MPNATNVDFEMQGGRREPVPVHAKAIRALRELSERAALERGGADG